MSEKNVVNATHVDTYQVSFCWGLVNESSVSLKQKKNMAYEISHNRAAHASTCPKAILT